MSGEKIEAIQSWGNGDAAGLLLQGIMAIMYPRNETKGT